MNHSDLSMSASLARPVSLPPGALFSLHRALSAERSAAEAAFLLRQIGYAAGEAFFAAFSGRNVEEEPTADALPAERFWERLSSFFAELGWGRLQWEPLHPGVAALDSADWAEAEGREGERHPGCHLTTGLLSDLLTRIAEGDVAVLETECRARGEGRCRFLFGSPDVLGKLYEAMRQGVPYAEALGRLE